ncbi:MAG: exodeoxyribonuclease III [Gammaproteobacteria bacterium]
MKFASWNVNSLRVRLPQVLEWLKANPVDVLGLQETKTQDPDFPLEALNNAGYDVAFSGQKTYNGVALLARRDTVITQFGPLESVVTDLPGLDDPQRRVLIATCGDIRIANLYVPNGAAVGSEKYAYKLNWLGCLHRQLEQELSTYDKCIVMGDFNIAPADEDVHDPAAWEGNVIVSPDERAAYFRLLELGFTDTFRAFEQEAATFSWWDYRAAGFRRNRGVRIDLILASRFMQERLVSSLIDKAPRGWERPSDHAPTVAEFTL